jgi:hypothetical protein
MKFADGGSINEWFDITAFAVPGKYQFGNCSNAPGIFSPPTDNVNFSVFKNFVPAERFRVQFRTEFFNLFNHPQFAPPSVLTVGANGFGSITQLLQNPRQIQFALKMFF